jgi:TPR repeat protein
MEHLGKGCDFYEVGEFSAAEHEFLRAAKLGNPEAQVNLGNMYSSNELGAPEFQKAIRYYKRAILKGSPLTAANASVSLAITYRNLGKQRPYLFWMRRAAALETTTRRE